MTASVLRQASGGQKIAMTATVMQESTSRVNEWKVRFVMPAEYTLASQQKPDDTRVKFSEVPAYRVAVIRFSGFNTDTNLKRHQDALVYWIEKEKMTPISEPVFAFYNSP